MTGIVLLLTFTVMDVTLPVGFVRGEETPMLYSRQEIAQMRRMLATGLTAALVLGAVAQNAYSLLVAGALRVGKCRFMLEDRIEDAKMARLWDGFRKGEWWNTAKAMYGVTWRVELASLLVVPGVILRLKWSLVPYLLAENPRLSGRDARQLSARMTQRNLWRIARMWLGFSWMHVLLLPTCGAGLYFLWPLQEAVGVELYAALRQEALEKGKATAEELPGVELTL